MQIADAAGAYTGINALMAAGLADARTATQQRNDTEDQTDARPQQAVAEAAQTAPRVVLDRVEVQNDDRDRTDDNQMQKRMEALREAQMGRELEEVQLRAKYRDQIKMDLGLTDEVLAQASMSQRFMYERQIEDRLETEIRRELVNRTVEEGILESGPSATPNILSAATATGMLSESDLPRISIRA